MKNTIKNTYSRTLVLALSLFTGISTVNAKEGFNASLAETAEKTGHNTTISIPQMIGNVISIVLGAVGIVFIVLIIYAGYTWMLARGDEAEAKKAKETIGRAVVGLFIVLSAYAITAFIGGKL